jgi:hypothetical protein
VSTHGLHDRNENGLPLLCDGCERCEEQAGDLGIHLDNEKWRKAWVQMLVIEFEDTGGYRSEADKKLGSSLYVMALILQRQGIDPRVMLA